MKKDKKINASFLDFDLMFPPPTLKKGKKGLFPTQKATSHNSSFVQCRV
jgi:hypothetical protein